MPCYKPLKAWQHPETGKIVFWSKRNHEKELDLPCGQCIGCRIQRSKEWAIRCVHEAQMHGDENCFITLTYDQDHLPKNSSLKKEDFQKFIRSLRQRTGSKIRYYMCGEYGEQFGRPHYHAILFGYRFPDAYFWAMRRQNKAYRSDILEQTWIHGNAEIGGVTFQSAAYVARYVLKKRNGQEAESHYAVVDQETGEISDERRVPEYTNMSLKPGIGHGFYKKYMSDIFPADRCVLPNGHEMPAPKYYRNELLKDHPILHELLREHRVDIAKNNTDNTPERLASREICQYAKNTKLKREIE